MKAKLEAPGGQTLYLIAHADRVNSAMKQEVSTFYPCDGMWGGCGGGVWGGVCLVLCWEAAFFVCGGVWVCRSDRKTSRTALLCLRSLLSAAFLASFLSRGSQRAGAYCFSKGSLESFLKRRKISKKFPKTFQKLSKKGAWSPIVMTFL